MSSDLITPEEIAFVRSKVVTIDMVKILNQIEEGRVADTKPVIVKPHELASGYTVSFSIDIMPMYPESIEHLGVGHINLEPDPADVELIAKAFLGTYIAFGMFNPDIRVHHFMKCKHPDCMKRLSALQQIIKHGRSEGMG